MKSLVKRGWSRYVGPHGVGVRLPQQAYVGVMSLVKRAPGGTKTTKRAYEVIKGHWPLMTSDDLGKVTVSVRTTDITSQHLSMSISPANIPKFTSFKRWNGTERKFRLTWPRKSGHRSNVIVGTDLKFSGKVWNCSTVRYTYQVSWRSADPFVSYSWKTRGGCINPPVPLRWVSPFNISVISSDLIFFAPYSQ